MPPMSWSRWFPLKNWHHLPPVLYAFGLGCAALASAQSQQRSISLQMIQMQWTIQYSAGSPVPMSPNSITVCHALWDSNSILDSGARRDARGPFLLSLEQEETQGVLFIVCTLSAGVVNRSQQDILSHRNIGEARDAELEFFESHPEYSSVAAHCGLHNLAKALNHILVDHIRALLPSLKASIEDLLDKRFHELKLYGDPLSGQSADSRYCIHPYSYIADIVWLYVAVCMQLHIPFSK